MEKDLPHDRHLATGLPVLLRSRANTLVSVRQVTQRNAGRKTAGIDGRGRVDLPGPGRSWRCGCTATHPSWQPRAGQAGVHSQGRRKTKLARSEFP